MKKRTWIILGVAGAVAVSGGIAIAKKGPRGGHGFGGKYMMQMFDKADADGDKSISSAEFASILTTRFDEADADKNGIVTKGEAVTVIEKNAKGKWMSRHAGRMADRMVVGFDIDKDGSVTKAEFENRANKMYALADWNDDNKVNMDELKRTRMGMGRRGHGGKYRGKRHGGEYGDHMKNDDMQEAVPESNSDSSAN